MGNQTSANANIQQPSAHPEETETTQQPTCPVVHRKSNSPIKQTTATENEIPEGCPMHSKNKQSKGNTTTGTTYNVYGERIDPTNQMPPPQQEPFPGQRLPLSMQRIQSTIRKGGTEESTWVYPSEQMFYNALKRKGKGDDVDEEDIAAAVAAHNGLNERTWEAVRDYERYLHSTECADPTLLRFRGRPDDLSPKAWFKHYILRQPKPFDRHDWIVDRCGKHVRYVIDFYYDEESNADPAVKNGFYFSESFHIDARPAVDNLEATKDRLRMWWARKMGNVEQ